MNKTITKQAYQLQLKKAVELGLATHNKFLTILEVTVSTTDLYSPLSLPRFQ